MDFVEIGTSDFDTLIQVACDSTHGLTIEPISYYLNKLPDKPNVMKLQSLVSHEKGFDTIHYIDPDDIEKYNLPWEIKGMNTIKKPHPGYEIFNITSIKDNNIQVKYEYVKKDTLYNILMENSVTSIGYLKIDTEGHDCFILNKFLEDVIENGKFSLLPTCIKFESNQWTDKDVLTNTKKSLSKFYISLHEGHDTILVRLVSLKSQ